MAMRAPGPPNPAGRDVTIPIDGTWLKGDLILPQGARAVILFAHGSGSSRLSPRNRFVAEVLQQARLGTLLFDLLTEQEEAIDIMTAELRFNIDLLADRLIGATDWAIAGDDTRGLKIGYFGASTGAAAALIAAAARPRTTYAVVSRGGRPDLAGRVLNRLTAPTLLIVGGEDPQVIKLNEQALEKLPATTEKELRIIPGATHLFEEPGTLEEVSRLATDWFTHYL